MVPHARPDPISAPGSTTALGSIRTDTEGMLRRSTVIRNRASCLRARMPTSRGSLVGHMEVTVVIPVFKQPHSHRIRRLGHVAAGCCRTRHHRQRRLPVRVDARDRACPRPCVSRKGVLRPARPNGGLSAARNTGIDVALTMWPGLDAVFPLDADNRLSPDTLARLASVLDRHPEAAWASPNLETFGHEHFVWEPDRRTRPTGSCSTTSVTPGR